MEAIPRPRDPASVLAPGLLVAGEWHGSGSAGQRDHVDPATGRVQQCFPLAGADEVAAAVAGARTALAGWRAWSADRRRDVLTDIGRLIREHADELATINALEVGTPAQLSRQRYVSAPTFFEYYAGWLDKATGQTLRVPGGLDLTLLEPVGVVGVILTWNHPLATIQTMVAPALAAGCTVVLKPPAEAPFAALRFARLCEQAGLPSGVLSVLPGEAEAGEALVRHPEVDKIGFVGGPGTASRIQAAAAGPLTPLLLELGGKSPCLVFPDADLDAACRFALVVTANSGQGCTVPTRLLVHERVSDRVMETLLPMVRDVGVGDPFDPTVRMGPVVSAAACERILAMVARAREQGAGELVLGGGRMGGPLADGFFVEPTVFTDVNPTSELATEEIFGPVLSVMRFRDEDEAVALANAGRYGLAGYVHTRDLDRALRVAGRLDAGSVGINGAGAPAGAFAPFGGFKDSGYGKVGGLDGLREFLRTKNVLVATTGQE